MDGQINREMDGQMEEMEEQRDEQMLNYRREFINKLQNISIPYYNENYLKVPRRKNFAVFACPKNFIILCREDSILMADHLSDNCPILQYYYMVHGIVNGNHMPIAMFLLLKRDKDTYMNIWNYLGFACMDRGWTFRPRKFRLDIVQDVARAAFVSIFPWCAVYVSVRRLLSLWYRRYAQFGLELECVLGDTPRSEWLRGVFGLPYLPASHVRVGFAALVAARPDYAERMMPFLRYVDQTFVRSGAPCPMTDWALDRRPADVPDVHVDDFVKVFDKFLWSQRWTASMLTDFVGKLQNMTFNGLMMLRYDREGPCTEPDDDDVQNRSVADSYFLSQPTPNMPLVDFIVMMGNIVEQTIVKDL